MGVKKYVNGDEEIIYPNLVAGFGSVCQKIFFYWLLHSVFKGWKCFIPTSCQEDVVYMLQKYFCC